MRVSKLVVLAGLSLTLALAGAPPASAGGVLAGTGYLSDEPPCPGSDSIKVAIAGAEAMPGTWVFNVAGVNTSPFCDFPGGASPFMGEFDPAGGCVPNIATDPLFGRLYMCLADPTASGSTITYTFNVCATPTIDCGLEGKATLVYAEA